jgi:hypothetical protein
MAQGDHCLEGVSSLEVSSRPMRRRRDFAALMTFSSSLGSETLGEDGWLRERSIAGKRMGLSVRR